MLILKFIFLAVLSYLSSFFFIISIRSLYLTGFTQCNDSRDKNYFVISKTVFYLLINVISIIYMII